MTRLQEHLLERALAQLRLAVALALSAGSRFTTKSGTASPLLACGTPTAPASFTPGCCIATASTLDHVLAALDEFDVGAPA